MNPQHEYPIKRTHFTFDIETGSRSFDEIETYCPPIKPHKGIKDADKQAVFIEDVQGALMKCTFRPTEQNKNVWTWLEFLTMFDLSQERA